MIKVVGYCQVALSQVIEFQLPSAAPLDELLDEELLVLLDVELLLDEELLEVEELLELEELLEVLLVEELLEELVEELLEEELEEPPGFEELPPPPPQAKTLVSTKIALMNLNSLINFTIEPLLTIT